MTSTNESWQNDSSNFINPFDNPTLMEKLQAKVGKQELIEKGHCEKCGRNYELYRNENGDEFKLGCDCEMIAKGIEQNKRYHENMKRRKVASVFNKSVMNRNLQSASFESYVPTTDEQQRALFVAQRYAESFSLNNPQSLLFKGTFGTGKSHLASSIAKEVKAKGYTVLFMNVPQLITLIYNTYNDKQGMSEFELMQLMSDVDLLILDDIGVHSTQNANGKLFQILESRQGKHTVYTTNLSTDELTANKDMARLYSRMKTAYPVDVSGDDFRNWRN